MGRAPLKSPPTREVCAKTIRKLKESQITDVGMRLQNWYWEPKSDENKAEEAVNKGYILKEGKDQGFWSNYASESFILSQILNSVWCSKSFVWNIMVEKWLLAMKTCLFLDVHHRGTRTHTHTHKWDKEDKQEQFNGRVDWSMHDMGWEAGRECSSIMSAAAESSLLSLWPPAAVRKFPAFSLHQNPETGPGLKHTGYLIHL